MDQVNPPGYGFGGIQGGKFTRGGKVLVVYGITDKHGYLYCFSSITGQYLGSRDLGTFGHSGTETEGVTVGQNAFKVYVLEVDNNWPGDDAVFLHTYNVPQQEQGTL